MTYLRRTSVASSSAGAVEWVLSQIASCCDYGACVAAASRSAGQPETDWPDTQRLVRPTPSRTPLQTRKHRQSSSSGFATCRLPGRRRGQTKCYGVKSAAGLATSSLLSTCMIHTRV